MTTTRNTESQMLFAEFTGNASAYLFLSIKNFLLFCLSCGFYYPWARISILQYFYNNCKAGPYQIRFHGKAKSVLLNIFYLMLTIFFAIGSVLYIVKSILPSRIYTEAFLSGVLLPIFYIAGLWLMNYLYFATKAYRFNNLTVNNMPMVFDLQISLEAGKFFRYSLISMFTLGLFYPVMQNRRMKTLYSHLKIQEERFQYDGVDSEYLKLWIFGIFFTVCTLGIYVFWLRQELFNYKINHLKLENRRFRCEVQGSKYFKLCVTNALLIIFSACILYPFTRVRTARHFVNGIQFDNSESINDIALPLSNQELFHKGYEFPFSIGI